MKKTIMNIRTMAALLIASAAFTACSNEDGAVIGEQPAATQTPQVYTLTLQAANATGAQHRALALDGTKLVAKWAAGDELTVINVTSMTPLGGTLTASNVSADGQTCTFSGTLTGDIAVDDQLALHYHATSDTQVGTLESAAASDQANAVVTVASAHEGNITISESKASFKTTTAVLKLTLKDGSANALNATSLKMTVDGVDIFTASPTAATYTVNGDGVLYFAVPEKFDAAAIIAQEKSGGSPTPELIDTWMTNLNTYDVTFTATVGSNTYIATKTGYKLAAGKYYATELTMAKLTDLSTISANYTVQDGEVLTGTLASNVKISIAAPVAPATTTNVTLKDVTINGVNSTDYKWAGITCEGDATITLEGTNTVKGFADGYPGIFVSSGKTLVIKGTGELNASSNGSYDTGSGGAGIGGGSNMDCGNIEIQSGTVTATGNSYGAGIGGGYNAKCGNITISGGTVTATGGWRAAGIGGGKRGPATSSCGNITISGGTITATGGEEAAGIGGGRGNNSGTQSSCGTITITSGVTSVTATKGSSDAQSIGAGKYGTCGAVTIEAGANVTATGLALSASAVGEIVGSDGKAYAVADKDYMPSGVTAAGLVAYKNGDNGLAIALTDEPSTMSWDDAMGNSGAKAHTPAVTGQTWKLPSYDDIEKMLSSYDDYWGDLNEAIANVGGTGLLDGPETYYWLSDESDEDEDEARYMRDLSDEPHTTTKDRTYLVRSVIAF